VKYAVEVGVRWSDMDAYGHVNHARTVTLLEEARTRLLFDEMSSRGLGKFADGIVVSRLSVEYLLPLLYDGGPVVVEIWVTEVKAAWFTLRYALRRRTDARVVATAETMMVPYDVVGNRPRRLAAGEREFLALWTDDGAEDGRASA
jgi:acyl-CoA thioester hydrolase